MRRVFLRTVVITRRRAPKFAKKVAKNLVLSSAAEVLLHHTAPKGNVVIDATFIESLEVCFKLLKHI